MATLADFWRQMGLNETVHPLDRPMLEQEHHSFRLEYPPPAFIGNIEKAPVIVLCSNGGWNDRTCLEFRNDGNSPQDYVQRLHNPGACNPALISPYYAQSNIAGWIASGDVALLNLIPYRSPNLGKEPHNERFAGRLASSVCAVQWINREIMPQAAEGQRLIFVKRNIWFQFIEPHWSRFALETQRRGPHVSRESLDRIEGRLSSRRTTG